jgi:uncharacterized coiled-coil protein SlyX
MIEQKMKLEVQLAQCQAALKDLEYKVFQRKMDIDRIKEHINIHKEREAELKKGLDNIKE